MNPITSARDKIEDRIARLVRAEVQEAMEDMLPLISQLIEFNNSPREDRQSYHDHTKDPLGNRGLYSGLKERLLKIGIPVEDVDIDVSDFERWLDDFSEVKKHYQSMGDVFIEKCLEHYLAFRHLNICRDDIYVDIAAAGSPWANILNKREIRSYSLDLSYPDGMHGIKIGADASDTKLPDAFATVLSAQCAFEHFMGDADIRFIREAYRILNERGRYGIVPLYLDDLYFVATSPYCDQKDVTIENDARRLWRDDGYKVPFARHYSPESFRKRIYSSVPADSMTGKILYFRNLTDIMEHYQGQKIYCFFMFYCEKR